jgi:eukaryotic-like serine/threonine-protein kinase
VEELVFGRRYRVIEKVGSGGMAEVYKAVDEVLGRTVAVKVLHPRYAADPSFVARFRQEAQAAANLSHPGIVNIYDWGRDDETYYIVMEYVHGTDLKVLVGQQGALDPMKAAQYASQVCAALAVAHGYDIIHRDIKPHNIVLAPDGTVKVMDFGIARAGNTTMTQTGSVLGTAHYVSPEQAQGRPLGPGSDLYSLGIVLYELTTGQLPFDADTPVAVALKQVNEEPVPPRQINPDIPPALEAVIMRALQKDPATRYSSAEEMRTDLKRVLAGGSVDAPAAVAAGGMDETSVMPAVGRGRCRVARAADT